MVSKARPEPASSVCRVRLADNTVSPYPPMTDLPRLRDLFDALLEVPAEDWEHWFEQRCVEPGTRAELLQLAKADASRSGLLDRSLSAQTEALASSPSLPENDPA